VGAFQAERAQRGAERVAEAFAVSKDAARTRLLKLGYVAPGAVSGLLALEGED